MPTCSSAEGRPSANARAVATAASTGPRPHTSTGVPSAPASSRSVAATTRITPERYSPRWVNQRKELRTAASQHSAATKTAAKTSHRPGGEQLKEAVHRRGGLSYEPCTPGGGFLRTPARSAPLVRLTWDKPHPEV